MNLRNFIFLTISPLLFCACSDTNARVAQMETSLAEVEEKVDALLTYSNTTHDAITDIDLRMEALEQDAKKRGVPVRIKGVDLAAAKAELDRIEGNYSTAPSIQPVPLAPLTNQSDENLLLANTPQTPETTNTTENALAHLAQDEQALLAQSPTLAALQNNAQGTSNKLPEQDMSAPIQTNGRSTQHLADGYRMAEGINIRLPDTANDFEYPEHTQSMDALDNTIAQNNNLIQDQVQNVGPITGQNLQAPSLTQQSDTLGDTLTPIAVTPPSSPYTPETIPEPVSLTPKQNTAPVTTPTTQASTQASAPLSPATANTYDGAMNLYKSRQYAESEKAFDAFLQANPNSPLAPNAIYWKGETYYARGLYPQAIFAFKEVQTRYPKHSKAPDSLLKTAMSYEKLHDTENANLHYTVLIEDFPNSPASKRAPR